ncbi:hypothetical protein BC629DRAFT_196716 [Irpex lacteus]|nr:hypothetical protein BC629DRAFT_196716 [Irpex lacteus]
MTGIRSYDNSHLQLEVIEIYNFIWNMRRLLVKSQPTPSPFFSLLTNCSHTEAFNWKDRLPQQQRRTKRR